MLALGIGACAVAFVLVEQVLLKPLPLSQPEQLMAAGKLRQGWPPRISTRQYAALQKLDGVQSIGLMAFATPTVNIMENLRDGGRGGFGRRSGRLGRALVIAQVALASLLLCATGIFLRSLLDNARVDLGFDARGVLIFDLAPVKATYPDAASVQALSQQVVDRLRLIPGVRQAAAGTNPPTGDFTQQWNMAPDFPALHWHFYWLA